MSITFSQASLLVEGLSRVLQSRQDSLEWMSANSCVLIEQLTPDTTQLSVIDPGYALIQRRIASQGIPETKYLVDPAQLKERLAHMPPQRSLTLQQTERGLNLRCELVRSQDRGNRLVSVYTGPTSDFGPIERATQLAGHVSAKDFSRWVARLNSFGGFARKSGLSERTLLLELGPTYLSGLTDQEDAYNTYLYCKIPLLTGIEHNELLSFSGRHLKSLQSLSKEADVEIYWFGGDEAQPALLTFSGDRATVTITLTELNTKLERVLPIFQPESERFPVLRSEQSLGLPELIEAVRMQLPAKDDKGRNLLLQMESADLVVSKPTLDRIEAARVALTSLEALEQPLTPVLINADALIAGVQALQSYLNKEEVPMGVVTQRTITRTSGQQTYLLYLRPLVTDAIVSCLTCTLPAIDRLEEQD